MHTVNKLFFALLLSLPYLANAHEDYSQASISVDGSAVKEVKPDVVVWHLSLRSEGKKPDELAAQHAKKLSELLTYLNKQSIKKDKIQTEHMQLSENWNYDNGKRFKQGYFASSSLSFQSDIKSYTTLWTGLATQEGVSVNGSYFDISNRIPIQVEARNLALKAAQEKAESMAKALGATIGKPLFIEDQSYTDDVREPQQEKMLMRMSSADMSQDIVAPGKLDVRMRVRVVFALE